MASPLIVKAGPTALLHLQQHGLTSDAVEVLVGASGGPKWFSLFGLDQYLCSEFFKGRQKPLQLLGSSAGAWRFACYGQQDPAAASRRFCDAYRNLCYPPNADIHQVTAISATVMDAVFPTAEHVRQVVENPVFQLNFVVARAKGISKLQPKVAQLGALSLVAAANLVHRRSLGLFYQRYLFQHPLSANAFRRLDNLPTERVALGEGNLKTALLATGAIPLVISPVAHIAKAGSGIFVDGGILDYHFDWPFSEQGLVLYPHFYPHLSPGWFDKSLKWRRGNKRNFHNLVLLCPSDSWVKSLPYGKIPDRTDFNKLSDADRIAYWQQVTERSFELAQALKTGNYQLEAL
ncbi:patatin-like phospholipase family protein [Rheinheimera sp.]|uniref:patatin-like phospholipase family protein n=1 Tax=Rheinheimera sp. TaxID=1869214 RepID=UPI002FDE96A6